jgi:hypothetical protein
VCAFAAFAAGVSASPASADGIPFAAGDSSANIPLKASNRWIANRWVADETGTIQKLYLRVRTAGATGCTDDPGTGYGAGSGGTWLVTTHPVTAAGTPRLGTVLASDVVSPCGEKDGNSVGVDLGIRVTAGDVLATVVRNIDPSPGVNFASQNFLYASQGLVGANARNELGGSATDLYYGLEPREVVGYSSDGGLTWSMPGGPYPASVGGRAFIPTFIEQYATGTTAGQPFYSSHLYDEPITMVYRVRKATRITALGAYTSGPGSAAVTMSVDGSARRTATLSGTGHLEQRVDSITVEPGDEVELSTRAGAGGLAIRQNYAGAVWARIAVLGTRRDSYLAGRPTYVAPLYPLSTQPDSGSLTDPPGPGSAGDAPGQGGETANQSAPTGRPPAAGGAAGGGSPAPRGSGPPAAGTTAVRRQARRGCVTPKMLNRRLTLARRQLAKARCRLGRVTRRRASRAKAGRVLHQAVPAGRRLAGNARISVVVGRG